MSVYKEADHLQEALDLLTDLEKRRETVLEQLPAVGVALSLQPAQVEQIIDGTHVAAVAHLFRCMMNFHSATEKVFAGDKKGS